MTTLTSSVIAGSKSIMIDLGETYSSEFGVLRNSKTATMVETSCNPTLQLKGVQTERGF